MSAKTELVTAQQLRNMIEDGIRGTISTRRRSLGESGLETYATDPTDEEITDFVFSNALFDSETVEQLFDPGLLGFHAKTAHATPEWIAEFKENIASWASTNSWLGGDSPFWNLDRLYGLEESHVWRPQDNRILPNFGARSVILLAEQLVRKQRHLSELDWRNFEKLIAELLERDGFSVILTQGSKDGGVDVIADKVDPTLGSIRTIWQAKRYSPERKVSLSAVRELSGLLSRNNSNKGFLVTTSKLTSGAIDWIRQDRFKLDYREHDDMAKWVLGDIPFLKTD